jgi:hypothetical protein
MNFSDSKVGKKHQDWLVNQMIATFMELPTLKEAWDRLSDYSKQEAYTKLHDTLRYNL